MVLVNSPFSPTAKLVYIQEFLMLFLRVSSVVSVGRFLRGGSLKISRLLFVMIWTSASVIFVLNLSMNTLIS